MSIIDRYAYNNRLRAIDPAIKAALAMGTLLLCLALNSIAVGVITILWMAGLAILVAGTPPRVFIGALLAEGLFLALTTVGVAVSITARDPGSLATWAIRVGPLWVSGSPERVVFAVRLVARALGCASAMNFLSLTTPLVDLLELARRLHVPPLLVDLMTVIYRFIFVLLESLERMRIAQESRLGYVNFRRGMSSAGLLATRLFIDAYQRSQRLQTALDSRCYDSELCVLPMTYRVDRRLIALGVGIAASLVGARLAL
jgi:cobalt/nickel transport system permease protein